jgi:hypothetical protein
MLTPRPHFYGGHLGFRSLNLVRVRDYASGLSLYRKGSLDAARVPDVLSQSLSSHSDFHQSDGLDAYYALAAAGAARALAAVLDRDTLVQHTSAGLSALSGIVPPAIPDYVSSPAGADPAPQGGAAGIPAIRLEVPVHDPVAAQLRAALARQWPVARLGGTVIQLIHASYLLPDPGIWLRRLVPHRMQTTTYRSVLRRAARLTNDPVTRMSLYSEDEDWALQNGFVIPLASGSVSYLIKSRVQGLQVTPMGIMPDNNNWTSVEVS